MNADSIFLIMFILAAIIVAIGMYPYIIRLIRAGHAATDSLSDLYHHSIKIKQTKFLHENIYLFGNEKNDFKFCDTKQCDFVYIMVTLHDHAVSS